MGPRLGMLAVATTRNRVVSMAGGGAGDWAMVVAQAETTARLGL